MGAEFAGGVEATGFAFTHGCWWGGGLVLLLRNTELQGVNVYEKEDEGVGDREAYWFMCGRWMG